MGPKQFDKKSKAWHLINIEFKIILYQSDFSYQCSNLKFFEGICHNYNIETLVQNVFKNTKECRSKIIKKNSYQTWSTL